MSTSVHTFVNCFDNSDWNNSANHLTLCQSDDDDDDDLMCAPGGMMHKGTSGEIM